MHSVEENIEQIRQKLLVGQKRGNRFLHGQSRLAIAFQYPSVDWLWNELVVYDRKLQISKRSDLDAKLTEKVSEKVSEDTSTKEETEQTRNEQNKT